MRDKTTSDSWKWWAAIALVIAFSLIEYAPVLLSGRVPIPATILNGFPPYVDEYPQGPSRSVANIGDLITSFYPYHALAARSFRQGSLALWNPNMLSGDPLAGSTQSALFYPPNYLYYFLELSRAWSLELVIQRILAVLFTLLLLRELGATRTGAIVAALLFGFCGFLIGWQGQAMADSAVWLPLICYALLRLNRESSGKWIALLAAAFAMPVLAGHPETAAHLAMTGIGIAACLVLKRSPNGKIPNLKFAGGFIAAALLSMGLAAIQILPTLEWILQAHRSPDTDWPALPLKAVLAFVSRDMIRATNSAGLEIPEQAAYLGMIVFAAAPLAWLHSSRKVVLFLIAGCAVVCSIIYGVGPLLPMLNSIPYLGFKQWRFILVLSLGLAVLAGLGISALEKVMERSSAGAAAERRRSSRKAALLAFAGVAAGLAMIFFLNAHTTIALERSKGPASSLMLLLAGGAVIYSGISGWIGRMHFSVIAVCLVAFDVLTFSYAYLPFHRAREVYPNVELFARLQKLGGDPFRIAQIEYAYPPNIELVYDLESTGGYEIPLERLYRFLDGAHLNEADSVMLDPRALLTLKDRRVDMLNTRYILVLPSDPAAAALRNQTDRFRYRFTAGRTDVLENLNAMPRAFVVPATGVEVIADPALQLSRVKDPSFNPERAVILGKLEEGVPNSSGSTEAGADAARLRWLDRNANGFSLEVHAPTSSVLVASQIYYPGWKASIDDVTVPVVPANYALAAILLPAGAHHIRFFYDPDSIRIGKILSVLSIAMLAVLTWLYRQRGADSGPREHLQGRKAVLRHRRRPEV